MRFFVFGNINSGKSTIIKRLQQKRKTYAVLQIDEFRKIYGDGTLEGEEHAQNAFIDSILAHDNALVEFSGYGKIADKLRAKIQDKSMIVLYKQETLSCCLERLIGKDFTSIPYPNYGEPISTTIQKLDKHLNREFIQSYWKDKIYKMFVL